MKFTIPILLFSLLFISCNNKPIRYESVPKNPPKEIQFKTNLIKDRYLKDTDTLKIVLLDTNLVTAYNFKSFFSFRGNVEPSIFNTKNEVYELIHLLLTDEVNPSNPYELWVHGFEANVDSNYTKNIGRYLHYTFVIGNTMGERYYLNNEIDFDVVSTTE